MCGGGGYAISSKVLQRLFDNFLSQKLFYETYMMFNNLTQYSDITTSHFLTTYADTSLVKLEGLHPWKIKRLDQYISKGGAGHGVPILTLHYAAGRMQEYKDIVHKLQEE